MTALSPAARATLAELADALMPGGEGMPVASVVGTAQDLLDRVLAVRPHAAPTFVALAERLAADPGPGEPVERAQRLRRDHPADFSLLAGFLVGAYQLAEPVRAAIGYPGQGPSDVSFDDETGYIAEGLLDPVLERGSRARGLTERDLLASRAMTDSTTLSHDSAASGPDAGDLPGPLVSVAWLAAHLGDADLRLVHTSSLVDIYPEGHIPGAVFADLYHELNERGEDPAFPGVECHYLVPSRDALRASLARWGVAAGDRVVFCDDWARNRQAVRGLWLLRLYGWPVDRVHVLDGGLTAWQKAGLSLTAEVPASRTVAPVDLGGGDATSLATLEQVRAWSEETLTGGPIRILDVRKPAEYAGTDLQSRRGGHVPGAVNVDWELFVHADNTFRSPAEIRSIVDRAVQAHGGTDATTLRAAYCQGGVRAAAAWFALSVLAGVPIANYARSWEEWGNRDDTPIDQPADQ